MREEEVIFHNYLETYFKRRDLASTILMLSPSMTGFGTGFDERCYDFNMNVKLYERDIRDIPSPISYEIKNLKIHKPAKNVFIVWCELDIAAFVLNHSLKLNSLRLSMTWVKHKPGWLIESMHLSFPTDIHREGEAFPLKEIEDQNKVLQRLLDEKTEELNVLLAEMRTQAITDRLTQLYNRIKIEEVLREEIEKSKRYRTLFSVIFLDIDHFKKINDEFGHIVGDNLLIEFSAILSKRIRKSDICGRWGGEEFIIICPNTNLEKSCVFAENLRELIENHRFSYVEHITSSFGVTSYIENDSIDSILYRADAALYEAKRSGRNKVICINEF